MYRYSLPFMYRGRLLIENKPLLIVPLLSLSSALILIPTFGYFYSSPFSATGSPSRTLATLGSGGAQPLFECLDVAVDTRFLPPLFVFDRPTLLGRRKVLDPPDFCPSLSLLLEFCSLARQKFNDQPPVTDMGSFLTAHCHVFQCTLSLFFSFRPTISAFYRNKPGWHLTPPPCSSLSPPSCAKYV